jgi:peptide/nickel transport system substrate-binding protein
VRRRAFLAAVAAALIAGGCAPSRGSPTQPAGAFPVVYIKVPSIPDSLAPLSAGSYSFLARQVLDLVLPQTFFVNGKDAPQLNSDLVSSAETVSIQPETVLYVLNPKARWSDGTPIGLADFQRMVSACSQPPAWAICPPGYREVAKVEQGGAPNEVLVTFSQYFGDWESLFNDLVPPRALDHGRLPPSGLALQAWASVSGGPYELASFQPGREVVLRKNPKYWEDLTGPDRIVFSPIEGSLAGAAEDIAAGAPEVIEAFPSPQDLESIPKLAGVMQAVVGTGQQLALYFNPSSQLSSNALVRRALARLIDRGMLAADTTGLLSPNQAALSYHLAPPASPLYAPSGALPFSADIAQATALLQAAGMRESPAGAITNPDGSQVSVSIAFDNDDWSAVRAAQLIQFWLVRAGLAVTLKGMSAPGLCDPPADVAIVAQRTPFDYSLLYLFFGLGADLSPAPGGPSGLCAANPSVASPFSDEVVLPQPLQLEEASPSDEEARAAFLASIHELDPAKIEQALSQADADLWADAQVIPLVQEPLLLMWPMWLRGFDPDGYDSGPTWSAGGWSWSAPSARKAGALH